MCWWPVLLLHKGKMMHRPHLAFFNLFPGFFRIVCSRKQQISSHLRAQWHKKYTIFPLSIHNQKLIAYCFPLAFACYSINESENDCDLLGFHFSPRGNKGRKFQRVRRHLILLYIQHNTLHRCLNCPLSAKWKKSNFIHRGFSKPFSLPLTHTRVETLMDVIHLQTAITVQQMLAWEENSWCTHACS